MEVAWILGGVFIFSTLVYVALAFFVPEWVGITGKKAREIMKEQEEQNSDKKE